MILVYQLLHVFSAILLTAFTFQIFANPDPAGRKGKLALTGILSLLMLTGGFGLFSKVLNGNWEPWIFVKIACWLGLSALGGIAYRKPEARPTLQALAIALVGVALYMVYGRPF